MKHYSLSEWSDYARSVGIDPEMRGAMEIHLRAGCSRCAEALSLWQGVVAAAQAESLCEPPAHAVRSVRAYFALQRPEGLSGWRALPTRIDFDSVLAPEPAGVRGLVAGRPAGRHLVCHTETVALDLRTDRAAAGGEMVMVGQIVGSADGPLPNVPAFLISRGEIVSRAFTGEHGEFQMSFPPAEAVRLCLLLDDDDAIDLSLDLPVDH